MIFFTVTVSCYSLYTMRYQIRTYFFIKYKHHCGMQIKSTEYCALVWPMMVATVRFWQIYWGRFRFAVASQYIRLELILLRNVGRRVLRLHSTGLFRTFTLQCQLSRAIKHRRDKTTHRNDFQSGLSADAAKSGAAHLRGSMAFGHVT